MTWDIRNYSATPGSNTAVNGINIAENCNASGINDAIRQIMTDVGVWGVSPLAFTAGGTADALTVTLSPAPITLTDGMTIQVRAGASPNATTTPTLIANAIGTPGTIVKQGGQALSVGDITANMELQFRYISASNKWELLNPKAITDFATISADAATTLAGTSTTKALTPAGFAGNKSLTGTGFYKLPGGFTIQWGHTGTQGPGNTAVAFPVAFSSTFSLSITGGSGGATSAPTFVSLNANGFTAINNDAGNMDMFWMAVGTA